MADLRTLLHDAAPVPSGALDMAAVRRRSQRMGLRRAAIWLAGLGVVVAVGVPVAGGLVASSGPDAEIRIGPGSTTTTTASEPAPEVADAPSDPAAPGSSATPDVAVDRTRAAWSTVPARPGPSPTTAARPFAASGFPPAAECSVDNEGLAAGEQRRCRFTATATGGAGFTSSGPVHPSSADVRGHVFITRGGVTTGYEVVRPKAEAGDLGVFVGCDFSIEPGDLVEVVLTNGSDRQLSTTVLGAGDGWAC